MDDNLVVYKLKNETIVDVESQVALLDSVEAERTENITRVKKFR
jgi:hypothetical protein